MQYGRALDRFIIETVIADPTLGPVYVLKADFCDGFYNIGLRPTDAPNLGLIFPSDKITLPMVWKKSPLIFCVSRETVLDLSNTAL